MSKVSSFKNMAICLFTICLVCSALLGGVYALTKNTIASAQQAKVNNAIALVVPEFDNDPSEEMFTVEYNNRSYKVFPAKKSGEIAGYAVESSTSKGFGGQVVIMVGFDAKGVIYNTSIISHAETPGLGDKMDQKKSDFSLQFNGKDPAVSNLAVTKDGGEIDAISAATISSRAFIDAIETAYAVFSNIKQDR